MTVTLFRLYQQPLATGSEKELLHANLQLARAALLWKLADLSEADVRKPMTRTGTNLLGIVKHLSGIEYGYFCDAFGRPREEHFPWESEDELSYGGDMWARPDETTEDIVGGYRRACAAADATIRELDLDTLGRHHTGLQISLRWMILNVLMDTTRHLGHADVVRELIDGRVGWYPEWPGTTDDEEYLRKYIARMRGEIDANAWLTFARSRVK